MKLNTRAKACFISFSLFLSGVLTLAAVQGFIQQLVAKDHRSLWVVGSFTLICVVVNVVAFRHATYLVISWAEQASEPRNGTDLTETTVGALNMLIQADAARTAISELLLSEVEVHPDALNVDASPLVFFEHPGGRLVLRPLGLINSVLRANGERPVVANYETSDMRVRFFSVMGKYGKATTR